MRCTRGNMAHTRAFVYICMPAHDNIHALVCVLRTCVVRRIRSKTSHEHSNSYSHYIHHHSRINPPTTPLLLPLPLLLLLLPLLRPMLPHPPHRRFDCFSRCQSNFRTMRYDNTAHTTTKCVEGSYSSCSHHSSFLLPVALFSQRRSRMSMWM